MTKPDDIPEDVWLTAAIYVGTTANPDIVRYWIARAVLAERERFTQLTEAAAAVMAEAGTMSMTMRRRAIFNRLGAAYTAIEGRS